MPAMPRVSRDVVGGLQETDDGDGTNVLVASEEEGGVPGVPGVRS